MHTTSNKVISIIWLHTENPFETLALFDNRRVSDAPENMIKCSLTTAEKREIFHFYTRLKEKY